MTALNGHFYLKNSIDYDYSILTEQIWDGS